MHSGSDDRHWSRQRHLQDEPRIEARERIGEIGPDFNRYLRDGTSPA